jgi:large subunit ribosomal protein L24e
MTERKICTFCGNEIEPGTGKMYVKKDGSIFNFCSNKCQKNQLKLKRIPRRVRWTKNYQR